MEQKEDRLTIARFKAIAATMVVVRAVIRDDGENNIMLGSYRNDSRSGHVGYVSWVGKIGDHSPPLIRVARSGDGLISDFLGRCEFCTPRAAASVLLRSKPNAIAYVTCGDSWEVEDVPPYNTHFLSALSYMLGMLEVVMSDCDDSLARAPYAHVSVCAKRLIYQQLQERARVVRTVAL